MFFVFAGPVPVAIIQPLRPRHPQVALASLLGAYCLILILLAVVGLAGGLVGLGQGAAALPDELQLRLVCIQSCLRSVRDCLGLSLHQGARLPLLRLVVAKGSQALDFGDQRFGGAADLILLLLHIHI